MKYLYSLVGSLIFLLILVVIGSNQIVNQPIPIYPNKGQVFAEAGWPPATLTPFLPSYTRMGNQTAGLVPYPLFDNKTPNLSNEMSTLIPPIPTAASPLLSTVTLQVSVMLPLIKNSDPRTTFNSNGKPEERKKETPQPQVGLNERAMIPVTAPDDSSELNPEIAVYMTATPFEPFIPSPTATSIIPTPTSTPEVVIPVAEEWKEWPVLSVNVSDHLKQVYQQGLLNGNNPNAFSILGDCQSLPDVFMGVYDQDSGLVNHLDQDLQETVKQFSGSFDRYSPTVKDGTTEGALLWPFWNENREGKCEPHESPIDCELRVHKPVIALIHVGTHWETRNELYLTQIIEKLLANGTVPVMVTKADNREFDERINQTIVKLAAEYDLPLWNFWASVQDLPNHGLRYGQNMYLSAEGVEIHRLGALQVLDVVWRELQYPDN